MKPQIKYPLIIITCVLGGMLSSASWKSHEEQLDGDTISGNRLASRNVKHGEYQRDTPKEPETNYEEISELLSKTELLEKDAVYEKMSAEDFRNQIEWLFSQIGPSGFSSESTYELWGLMEAWADLDSNSAGLFVTTYPDEQKRRLLYRGFDSSKNAKLWLNDNLPDLLETAFKEDGFKLYKHDLISVLGEKDPVQALEMAKIHLIGDDGAINVPYKVFQQGLNISTEFYLDCYRCGIATNDGKSSWSTSFAVNEEGKLLDMSAFAKGVLDIEKSLSEFQFLTMKPDGEWEYWSKTNPQEALDFLINSEIKSFNLGNFYSGYVKTATPSEVIETSHELIAGEHFKKQEVLSKLVNAAGSNISYHQPIIESPPEFREQVFVELAGHRSGNDIYKNLQKSILGRIPQEERITTLMSLDDRNGKDIRKFSVREDDLTWWKDTLQELGHSKLEAEAFTEKYTR